MQLFYLDTINDGWKNKTYITPEIQEVFDRFFDEFDSILDKSDLDWWGVHANLNMAAFDAGIDNPSAYKASTEYMLKVWGVDISKDPRWWNAYCHTPKPPLGSQQRLDDRSKHCKN